MSAVRLASEELPADRPEKKLRLDSDPSSLPQPMDTDLPDAVNMGDVDVGAGQAKDNNLPVDTLKPKAEDAESTASSNPVIQRDPLADGFSKLPSKPPPPVKKKKTKGKQKRVLPEPFTGAWVTAHEVDKLLDKSVVEQATKDGTDWDSPFAAEAKRVVEVTVSRLSSTGV